MKQVACCTMVAFPGAVREAFMHVIIGLIAVCVVGVSALLLAMAAISGGLSGV